MAIGDWALSLHFRYLSYFFSFYDCFRKPIQALFATYPFFRDTVYTLNQLWLNPAFRNTKRIRNRQEIFVNISINEQLAGIYAYRRFQAAGWELPPRGFKPIDIYALDSLRHLALLPPLASSVMGKSQSKLSQEQLADLQKNTYCTSLPLSDAIHCPHPTLQSTRRSCKPGTPGTTPSTCTTHSPSSLSFSLLPIVCRAPIWRLLTLGAQVQGILTGLPKRPIGQSRIQQNLQAILPLWRL